MTLSERAPWWQGGVWSALAGWGRALEVRAGIEPAFADLQSAASPLCHRTGARPGLIVRAGGPVKQAGLGPPGGMELAAGARVL